MSKNSRNISKENILQDDMNKAIDRIDKLNDIDFDIDINISEIILKAEQVKNKRKDIREFVLFLLVSLSLILAVSILILNGFNKIILYIEIILLVISPYIIIPAAIISKAKEAQ